MGYDLKAVAGAFRIYGDYHSAEPYGSGHINDTFVLTLNQGGMPMRYILQRINQNVFKDPLSLVENIRKVTEHLHRKQVSLPDASRRSLTLIPAMSGEYCYTCHDCT